MLVTKARQAEEEDCESADSDSDNDSDDESLDLEETSNQKSDLKTMPARKGRPAVITQEMRTAFAVADHLQSHKRSHDNDDADFVPGSG